MNILITGATGFIGINLAKRLLEEGHYVIGIDNFYASRRKSLHLFEKYPKFKFIEHDVRFQFPKFEEKIDWIFNLACPASPIHYQRDHIFTLDTNIQGIKNVVEVAIEHKAVLLHTSTSEVYGDPLEHPQKESYNGNVSPIGAHACYKEGKRVAETYLINYIKAHGLRGKIIRIFNTYGPYMDPDDGRVVSNFVKQALKDQDITVHGDGSQTRSFQYIDDLLNGMLHVINSPDEFTGPVNLGNPVEFTIKELAEKVLEKVGGKSKIIFTELREDDPKVRKPDITYAKNTFGWQPVIQLSEGLDSTIEYFRELLSENNGIEINDQKIIEELENRLKKLYIANLNIKFEDFNIDHVAYVVSTEDEYNDKKLELGEYAKYLKEMMVGNKKVAFYSLIKPIIFQNYTISALEIVFDTTSTNNESRFDHFEFEIKKSFDELLSEYPEIEFNLNSKNRELFPKVDYIVEGNLIARFHEKNILEELSQIKK